MKKTLGSLLIAALLATAALASTADAGGGGKLVVEVSGLHSDKGQVLLRLFDRGDGFPTDASKAVRQFRQKIVGGKATVEIEGMPAGDYAIACAHDENSNGKLDTNWVGAPKEGIGVSNDAKGRPPKWKDARFQFDGNAATTRIRVHY